MQRVLKDIGRESLSRQQNNVITTTLYELVEAINVVVQPEEEQLVTEIVINLLNNYNSNCRMR